MNRLNSRLALLLTVAMMFAMAPAAGANTVAPGGTTTNLSANPGDFPVTLLTSISGTFAGVATGSPSGTYTASVFRNSNGFLDFVYHFNNTGNRDVVDSVTMSNFAGFTTDLFVFGPGQDPDFGSRTAGNPSVVKFLFTPDNDGDNDQVGPGMSSDTLVIATNATNWEPGLFTFQNGDTDTVRAFEPTSGVVRTIPEPSSMLLFGTGLSGLAATLRRRIKK